MKGDSMKQQVGGKWNFSQLHPHPYTHTDTSLPHIWFIVSNLEGRYQKLIVAHWRVKNYLYSLGFYFRLHLCTMTMEDCFNQLCMISVSPWKLLCRISRNSNLHGIMISECDSLWNQTTALTFCCMKTFSVDIRELFLLSHHPADDMIGRQSFVLKLHRLICITIESINRQMLIWETWLPWQFYEDTYHDWHQTTPSWTTIPSWIWLWGIVLANDQVGS